MQQRFFVWLSDNPGEAILRWIFRVAVTVTIAALAVDLAGMNGWGARPDPAATPAEIRDLPSIVPSILAPLLPGGDKRLLPLPPPDGAMAKPMTFELVSGGKRDRVRLLRQDKGHGAEVDAFVSSIATGIPALSLDEIASVTRCTFVMAGVLGAAELHATDLG